MGRDMRIEKDELSRSTTAGTDILDLTADVERFVAGAAISDGWQHSARAA